MNDSSLPTIGDELRALGVDYEELKTNNDTANGRLTINRPGSRTSDIYTAFQVEAVRFLTNWEVSGRIYRMNSRGNPWGAFGLSLDERAGSLIISIGSSNPWRLTTTDSHLSIINNHPTAELMIKCVTRLPKPDYPTITLSAGSFIYVKDVS